MQAEDIFLSGKNKEKFSKNSNCSCREFKKALVKIVKNPNVKWGMKGQEVDEEREDDEDDEDGEEETKDDSEEELESEEEEQKADKKFKQSKHNQVWKNKWIIERASEWTKQNVEYCTWNGAVHVEFLKWFLIL